MIRIYDYESSEYMKELSLRNKVLRKPLGLNLFDEDLSQDEKDVHIGAFTSGKLVGCLLLSKVSDKIIKMRQVAVDEKEQGSGIGSRMVSFAEEWAKEHKFIKITMHARKKAAGFYIKRGYKIIGEEFTEVGIPHYTMEKYFKPKD